MIDVLIHPSQSIQLNDDERFLAFIDEKDYDQLVNDLEVAAKKLWPEKFKPRTLHNWHEEFLLQHNDDGSTDMVEIRKSDRLNREQQIPIGSRTR